MADAPTHSHRSVPANDATPNSAELSREKPRVGSGAPDAKNPKQERIASIVAGAVVLLVVVGGIASALWRGTSSQGPGELDVVALLRRATEPGVAEGGPRTGGLQVVGRVLRNGAPVQGALVWTILGDETGNRAAPPSIETGATGEFAFQPFDSVEETYGPGLHVRTHALLERGSFWQSTQRGQSVIMLDISPEQGTSAQFIRHLAYPMAAIAAVLGTTLILAFVGKKPRLRYHGLIVTSILMPSAVIWTIAKLPAEFTDGSKELEVLDVGFASIFEGRYLEDAPLTLLLSLTGAPRLPAPVVPGQSKQDVVTKGFGAPIWVVLVAVVGSALLTVSLVVREIRNPLDFEQLDGKRLRQRVNDLVQHQVFVVFAPLGGIFVYQALVIGEAASQPITVALAALGAGATFNALLAVAVERAETVFAKKPRASASDEDATG